MEPQFAVPTKSLFLIVRTPEVMAFGRGTLF